MTRRAPRLAIVCAAALLLVACDSAGSDSADDVSATESVGSTTPGDDIPDEGPLAINAPPPASTGARFEETFDGAPATPTPWRSESWDLTVHSRDDRGSTIEPMKALHGMDCAGPPSEHEIEAFADTVFQCKDHLMTSMNAEGYGLIYLTPDHLVDFSKGEAVISFDISTLRMSPRDWWDVWIAPYGESSQLEGESWYPDLNGPPRNGIQIKLADFNSTENGVLALVYRDFADEIVDGDHFTPMESVMQLDAARRDTIEIRISANHLKVGMPDYDLWWVDTTIPSLGWDRGVVQFGHHSYNPTKEPGGRPGTWHWDNVVIDPALPFTMIHADRREVSSDDGGVMRFESPAPDGASLRFAGFDLSQEIEYSLDEGATWIEPELTPHKTDLIADHFAAYFTPIPAGTRAVQFRGQDPGWSVRDATIWAR